MHRSRSKGFFGLLRPTQTWRSSPDASRPPPGSAPPRCEPIGRTPEAENRRLRERVRLLETRLSEVLGAEVAAEVTGQGLLAGEKALQEQIGALHAQVGELTDALRRKDEDLDGARQANRDLMAELNRRMPRP